MKAGLMLAHLAAMGLAFDRSGPQVWENPVQGGRQDVVDGIGRTDDSDPLKAERDAWNKAVEQRKAEKRARRATPQTPAGADHG